jgi:hypothetical protein
MATAFDDLIRKSRPHRMRRAEMVIVPRELELDRQITSRRYRERPRFWQQPDVRQFAGSFTLFFTAAMIFLA